MHMILLTKSICTCKNKAQILGEDGSFTKCGLRPTEKYCPTHQTYHNEKHCALLCQPRIPQPAGRRVQAGWLALLSSFSMVSPAGLLQFLQQGLKERGLRRSRRGQVSLLACEPEQDSSGLH